LLFARIFHPLRGRKAKVHELTLVQGIIDAVSDQGKERRRKVIGVEITLGELAQFDPRTVRVLLKELRKGTPLEGARVTLKTEKALIRCASCQSVWNFKEVAPSLTEESKEVVHFFPELVSSYFRCPRCSKGFFEILQGRSVSISRVKFDG
jgi:hydrogenase nickel incorporation protein HypA/HybF